MTDLLYLNEINIQQYDTCQGNLVLPPQGGGEVYSVNYPTAMPCIAYSVYTLLFISAVKIVFCLQFV